MKEYTLRTPFTAHRDQIITQGRCQQAAITEPHQILQEKKNRVVRRYQTEPSNTRPSPRKASIRRNPPPVRLSSCPRSSLVYGGKNLPYSVTKGQLELIILLDNRCVVRLCVTLIPLKIIFFHFNICLPAE